MEMMLDFEKLGTGWLFGLNGSTTGKTKCCLITSFEELVTELESLHVKLSETDYYLMIDTKFLPHSFVDYNIVLKLFQKFAIEYNIVVVTYTEQLREIINGAY